MIIYQCERGEINIMDKHVDFLYLDMKEVNELLPSYKDAIKIVENVFVAHNENRAILPNKFALDLEHIYGGHLNIMPGYLSDIDIQGIKLITAYINNYKKGLPSAMAMINLYDTKTGTILCIMEGSLVTLLRTGAATGVAAKYLAKENSKIAGFFGAGAVAPYHIHCVLEAVPSIEEVKIFDINEEQAEILAQQIVREKGVKAYKVKSHEQLVCNSDIVVTATRMANPFPLVRKEWVKPGCFIAATGQCYELDFELPLYSKIVVDNMEQCKNVHSGWGFSPLFDKKIISFDDIYADMGEIVNGKKNSRKDNEEIYILWARGLGTEDVAMSYYIYKDALAKKSGTILRLF